ncbi:carboxylesterase/lipase family protein [Sphingomonas cannabina]|uniref:carboxylesterase/lipase family protein n=1 Tax=Sphingomonas cannabina TaxID=2899123 RepID=UPI001F47E8C3|nr:carboxylesterase/lipase family protein [Sphingomonas cannabina]UIJ44712.1 carboxylesterase/lipase family protein [Sphingomonas cannabina]
MTEGNVSRRTVMVAGLALTLPGAAWGQSGSEVTAPAGTFVGDRQADGVTVFRGIRYGRAKRFMAPEPEPRAPAPVRAIAFGPSCPQAGQGYRGDVPGVTASEDCLVLNIWTTGRGSAPKPVMFYIHGGAYSSGTGSSALYDGSRLAREQDVVVVTVNHRLNAFGYLYLARLDPRFPDSGNCGQLDLILALKWVQDNIAAFGGDPKRVMVFGQSGGGAKIATMMGMPAARGLFHRAVTMSGQQVTASGPLNATARTRAFLAKLGDPGIDALLAMPAEKLVDGLAATDPILGGGVYFGPVLDMKWLARHPFWPDANPQSLAIPMILGNAKQETGAFIAPDSPTMQGLDWSNIAERMAPQLRIDILPEWVVARYRERYPTWSPEQVMWDATTAGRSWRGQVIEAEERARAGAPAWVYQVDFASRSDPRRGAMHTMDIPLAFGTLDAPGSQTGTGADARAASKAVQDSYVAFARTGDPNHAGLPRWPKYDLQARATMIFDTASRVENDPRRWQRELFARVPYIQPGT